MLILALLTAFAGLVVQWAMFAPTSYVDNKVQTAESNMTIKIDRIERMENEHYIELLKGMNEIKVILQDKQDRANNRTGAARQQ